MTFWEFLKTRKFWLHVLAAIVVSVLSILAFLWFLKYYSRFGSETKVPNFVGVYTKDLDTFIDSYDVEYLITDSIYDTSKPRGTVIEQNPLPGAKVKTGREVYLIVNCIKTQQVKMPDVVNLSLRQATAMLETVGLKVGNLIYVEGLPPVMKQLYKGKPIRKETLIDKGSSIDLMLGKGETPKVFIPDLLGKTLDEVKEFLNEEGLTLGVVQYDGTISDSSSARVYQQIPEVNELEEIEVGSFMDIWLTQDASKWRGKKAKITTPEEDEE
jgi:beta-lactam-binding protein with PASTA domain